jgi:hypothetical protein
LAVHLVHFSGFGIMYQEKSGNPVESGSRQGCQIILAATYQSGQMIPNDQAMYVRRYQIEIKCANLRRNIPNGY